MLFKIDVFDISQIGHFMKQKVFLTALLLVTEDCVHLLSQCQACALPALS